MNQEWLYDLIESEETKEVKYGFCIPLKAGGFAWLIPVYQDTYIQKSDEGHWYTLDFMHREGILKKDGKTTLGEYLEEIKSGEGNWIISPLHDNSDLKWSELDYENASIVKRSAKIMKTYTYETLEKIK